MLLPLLEQLRVTRPVGRPRTRPAAVLGDKAYSSRAIRTHLRARGIKAVIPEPADQQGHRRRRGARGGRPVSLDAARPALAEVGRGRLPLATLGSHETLGLAPNRAGR